MDHTITRIGHLSDIHVPEMSAFSPRDLFNKRITGWLNFKLHRAKEYQLEVLDQAIQRLIDANVDLVMVSGDFSNLAFPQEYLRQPSSTCRMKISLPIPFPYSRVQSLIIGTCFVTVPTAQC